MELQMFPHGDYAVLLRMLDEALKRSTVQQGSFYEIRLHDYNELLIDYCPQIGDSIERHGGATIASARVWLEGRCGFATGNILNERDLDALLEAAREASMTAPLGEQPLARDTSNVSDWHEPCDLSEEQARQRAKALADALCQKGISQIQTLLVRQSKGTIIIANSAGLRTVERIGAEEALLRCETQYGAIVDGMLQPSCSGQHWDIGPLLERVHMALDTVAEEGVPPDPHLPMVLRPSVAAPLVSGLAWLLRGDTAGRTPGLAAARTRKIFPAHLTVCDDPLHPLGTRQRRYDDEGQPSTSLALVQEGRLMNFLHSTQSAQKMASQSNGRGFVSTGNRLSPPVPQAINLYVCPVGMKLPDSYLELTTKLETLKAMPRAGLVTMTVAGWMVREGAEKRRIQPFALHLPLLPTWRRLAGVGDDLCFLACSDGYGTPSLLFPSLLS
jgi:predicted Zn-dependent protease